ncbi:ABC transporter permease [Phytohabitans sp. ZYX-F-186]|uniref:ABC transporter permease n=1 Tax=Phytohabitans maris TaxID=3071409 RepID=A0ABU0ZUE9_9ACTN|nr:ABC transporter permease [Phytohabitans sp. ZYX-F-186]MDQ7910112.1 ABC transporter permease [Phytohabitans sp. ZYX-F-186]
MTSTQQAAPAPAAAPGPAPRTRRSRTRSSLGRLVLSRLRDAVIVQFLVVVTIFVIGFYVGDPVTAFAPPDATEEQLAQLRHSLGLDQPFWVQFARYLENLIQLDVGTSVWQQRPAMDAVWEVIGNTVLLAVLGAIAAAIFGVVGGVLAGTRPGSLTDRVINLIAVVSLSVASFWIGLLLIIIFAVRLDLVPTSGLYEWRSLILPVATLGFIHGGRICQVTRSVVLDEMSKPYVLVARSRGLPWRRLVARHILRNVAATVLTTAGWEFARMFGGSIYPIEVVFAWPGLGPLMTTAAHRHDFAIVEAAVLITGALVILVNLVVDVASHLLDRRLRPQ